MTEVHNLLSQAMVPFRTKDETVITFSQVENFLLFSRCNQSQLLYSKVLTVVA